MRPLRSSILVFFFAYTALQWAGKNYALKGEFFPVFSWSLFTTVEDDVVDIAVKVHQIGETKFDPPVDYYDLPQYFEYAAKRDTAVTKAASQLARVAEMNDHEAYKQREATFQSTFFDIREPVRFQLVLERFDPLDRWRSGTILKTVILSEHVKKQDS